jgi:hypothetical protein
VDYASVIQKAIENGCTLEKRTKHNALRTPSGALVVFPQSPSDKWRGANQLVRDLRHNGVDVKQDPAQRYGPVSRVEGKDFFCREKRCGNLVCTRNLLGIDPDKKRGTPKLASFRSNACGYSPLASCAAVDWITDSVAGRVPRLCVLESNHTAKHRFSPREKPAEAAPVAAPAEVQPAEVPAAKPSAAKPSDYPLVHRRVGRRDAYSLADKITIATWVHEHPGRSMLLCKELGVSPKTLREWMRDPGIGKDPTWDGRNFRGAAMAYSRGEPVAFAFTPDEPKPEPKPSQYVAIDSGTTRVLIPREEYAIPAEPKPNVKHVEPTPEPIKPKPAEYTIDPPMLLVTQVGNETYTLAIPASELVKLVLKYRVMD